MHDNKSAEHGFYVWQYTHSEVDFLLFWLSLAHFTTTMFHFCTHSKYDRTRYFLDIYWGYSNEALARNGRSSRLQMFFKIGVLKNFAIFTGKHLCWNLFLIMLHARPFRNEIFGMVYIFHVLKQKKLNF